MLKLEVGGVPEHFNLPWHLAIEGDRFREANVQVRFHDYPGGTGPLSAALDDGTLDLATVLFEGALSHILSGSRYRIVKIYVDTPLVWSIHVAGNSQIDCMDAARGARYAISRYGSGSQLIAMVDAAERGWSTDDLKFVVVNDLEGARKALAHGEADLFFWEKYMTRSLVDSSEFRAISERVVPWPAFVVAARNDLINRHRGELRGVLAIGNAASAGLAADPAAARVIAGRYGLEWRDAVQWLSHTRWNHDFECPQDAADLIIAYLRRLGIVSRSVVRHDDYWARL